VTARTKLALGQWVTFEYEDHQIVGFTGSAVRLRAQSGDMQVIATATLISDSTFDDHPSCNTSSSPPAPAAPTRGHRSDDPGWDTEALWEDLSPADRGAALELEAHLLEVLTGFKCGEPGPDQAPRPQYSLQHPLKDRVEAKAVELGSTSRRIWYLIRRYRDHGARGLVDERKLRGSNPLARLDSRIIDAVLQQAVYEEAESTGTMKRFARRVQNRLDTAHGAGAVALPSESTFRRAVELLLPGRYTFGLAKTRQTTANQPDYTFGHVVAYRPGEIVMIDTSWLDVYAYDPVVDDEVECDITIALDLYSRSLLGWRITPLGTKAIDIGLIVADAMTPEPMRAGWPESLRYSMMQIPPQRRMHIDERLAAAAARPVIYPETLLVDHGNPYQSDVVRRACTGLGISFSSARKRQPTDKPEVEAVFRTIRLQFSEHIAGYKGSDVARRGRNPQKQARWTIPELEEFFAEYVVAVYQCSWHEGLTLPGYPGQRLSPNQAYELGVARAGYVTCPTDPTLYFQLMPIAWRKIHPDGVQINYLTYDADILYRYRNAMSLYRNHNGRWPIRYDPRNLLHAYFCDPHDGHWHLLRWTQALTEHQPFTDNTLREITRLVSDRGKRGVEQNEIAAALLNLQNRMDAPESWTSRDRRRAIRDADRARAAARDHHRALTDAAAHPGEHHLPPLQVVHEDPETPAETTDFSDDIDLTDIKPAETWHRNRPTP
jgi:putative transposase